MMTPMELVEQEQREYAEQAAQAAQGRVKNVQVLTRLWLALGSEVIQAARSGHQDESAEAVALAAGRWSRLIDLEQRVVRQEADIAVLAKGRPPGPNDSMTPTEILKKLDMAHRERVQVAREELTLLKAEAMRERKALEALIVPSIAKKG